MLFRFSFKHMETSSALQQYAQDKIKKEVEKFVTKPIEAHVSFTVDKHEHQVLCALTGGDGFSINVEHSCADMYGSVDHMIDKMVVQLQRKKEKLKDHKQPKLGSVFLAEATLDEDADYGEGEIEAEDIVKWEKAVKARRQ